MSLEVLINMKNRNALIAIAHFSENSRETLNKAPLHSKTKTQHSFFRKFSESSQKTAISGTLLWKTLRFPGKRAQYPLTKLLQGLCPDLLMRIDWHWQRAHRADSHSWPDPYTPFSDSRTDI